MRPPAIALRDLIVTYDRLPAVHHVTGTIAPGARLAITGPNGGGKSTLLKAIVGLLRPAEGRIDRGGAPPRTFAYLAQAAEIDRGFPLTVADMVAFGDWRRSGAFARVGPQSRERCRDALADVGMAGWDRVPIGELSAGQFQRILFARLIVQDAPVVLLDEPFAALDEATTAHLLALVRRWSAEGRTVVAVLHDNAQIVAEFPETVLMARECVAWGPTAEVLTPANLARARQILERWLARAEVAVRGAPGQAHLHAH